MREGGQGGEGKGKCRGLYRSKDREAQVNEESHHLEEEMDRMLDLLEGDIALIRRRTNGRRVEETHVRRNR
jgi:hypothetical protein